MLGARGQISGRDFDFGQKWSKSWEIRFFQKIDIFFVFFGFFPFFLDFFKDYEVTGGWGVWRLYGGV